jgi:Domain of unknown function (DUF4349)
MWRPERRDGDQLGAAALAELEILDTVLAGGPVAELDPEHVPLARLVRTVRDDHPPLRPAFAEELGLRVSAGFPGPRRPRLARLGRTRGRLLGVGGAAVSAAVVAVAAVAVVGGIGSSPTLGGSHAPASKAAAVAGTPGARTVAPATGRPSSNSGVAAPGTGGGSNQSVESVPAAAPATPPVTRSPAQPAAPSLAAGSTAQPAASGSLPSAGGARAVASDASLALVAPRGQVQQVTDAAIAATDRLGGIVESSNVSVDDEGGSQATLTLEVPSAALGRTLAALSGLAHVSSRSEDTLDITDPTSAARERLSESRAERLALLRQLGQASTPNQVASIDAQLGLVDGRITQDQTDLQRLVQQASMASVDVTIAEARTAAGGGGGGGGGSPWRPGRSLHDALTVLEGIFGILVIAAAGLIPAAGLAALGWWALRTLRRRRRRGALARAT